MARKHEYDEVLVIKVPQRLKRRLERAAVEEHTDMSKLTRQALEDCLDRLERGSRFEAWIEQARGTADSGMTTDEIMALTRGDD